ncbi:She9/Mdm33 family protein [Colletotrichum graminicola]|uniref:Sensitive to high expression protein 9, mitochondrial n=1 Tax=Colletotrichum graminicola (strain M1.001 / M2 / FGSC 10212) TaxID=645133 RepID=E3QV44_COLGM|nr:She9/Mdm33 family protein [Colletotrichum graminicola M1.001]EFQ34734.1 She9/Mdm33 family protein [Colletotrichum graminicola M1.001]WDK16900.1 She9/Mdm33 family protein [Colletotrichum graminicola]
MPPIVRTASRLAHARIGMHTTVNLRRWQPAVALALRLNAPPAAAPQRRLYASGLPPSFPPRPPPSSSASKEEIKQASPTSESFLPSSDAATSSSTSSSPSPSSTTNNETDTATSSDPDSSRPKLEDPHPETATKIYTALPPALSEKLSHLMDTLQTRLMTASTTLNTLTGYAPIEVIKDQNTLLENRLAEAQSLVRTARATYKTTNAKRATTQREVTTLLARKEMWSPTDLERFTQLYRQDHSLEQEVAAAAEALTDAEHAEQALGQQLNAGILKRYHEEQIWSDRIRRASTWGTWGLMGVNVLLFIVLQFVAEPWKRRRLVLGVVEEEKAVLEGVTAELAGLKAALAQREAADAAADVAAKATGVAPPVTAGVTAAGEEALSAKLEEPAVKHEMEREVSSALEVLEQEVPTPKSWRELITDPALPALMKAGLVDLYSERRIDLRMRDASILALEGAAAGATLAGGIALLLLRRT